MSCSASNSNSDSLHHLVTRNLVETGKFYCPFLERGYCRESTRCNFSHETCNSIKIPTDYCHFYLANQCLYGPECKFRHTEPMPIESQMQTSSTFTTTTNTPQPTAATTIMGQVAQTPPILTTILNQTISPDTLITLASHGADCDLCGRPYLHPLDLEQQRQHRDDCLREYEREMELSFAVQRSKDKVCGICMDTVLEKEPITSSRFGILENCTHIFCLECIRKWRGTKVFETRTVRACPECRVNSDFVVPSKYWVEDQDDKAKLIRDYKAALKSKPCRYFDEGKGDCPFGGSCFYKHAYPDGRIAISDPPKARRRPALGSRGPTFASYMWNILTATADDEWSNDELESLFFDAEVTDDDDEDDEEDEDDEDDAHGYRHEEGDDDEEDEDEDGSYYRVEYDDEGQPRMRVLTE